MSKVRPVQLSPTSDANIIAYSHELATLGLNDGERKKKWREFLWARDADATVGAFLAHAKKEGIDDDEFEKHSLYQKLRNLLQAGLQKDEH